MSDLGSKQRLQRELGNKPDLGFAVSVGSRASGQAHPASDWDIALQWRPDLDWMERIARGETLRHALAEAMRVEECAIDPIDLASTNLAMRALVAEEGLVLCGEDSLAWARFLLRTWRELEEYYWEQCYAA